MEEGRGNREEGGEEIRNQKLEIRTKAFPFCFLTSDLGYPLMDVPNQPKPKRKFVMTPERRAKLLANLEKARLAPKEKVYRKTPKRYAANVGNLAKANAKRREQSQGQQAENLRGKLEGFFPAPDFPPIPMVPPPGTPRNQPPRFEP